jgi:hypothetical protein
MDPNKLRDLVKRNIKACIVDPDSWERCERINGAERESLETVLNSWAEVVA